MNKDTSMSDKTADPFAALAIGLNEDRKAEAKAPTKRRGTKATETAADVAAKTAEGNALAAPAPTDATTADATPSDVSASSGPASGESTDQPDQDPSEATTGATDTPPAPGDDAEAVLDRRIDRLVRIAEEAEFDGGTLMGDLRDGLLELYRHTPKLWTAMNGEEKRRMERATTVLAQQLLKRVVLVIAEEDSRTIQGTLSDAFAVKGEKIEAKVTIEHVDRDVLLDLYGMAGARVVLVDASDKRFASSRKLTDHGNDEPDLPFESGAAPAATSAPAAEPDLAGPEGDDDLNPGDDEGSGVDAAIDAATASDKDPETSIELIGGDPVGIIDTVNNEWLIDEKGGDDGWTANASDAGTWAPDYAEMILGVFEDANLEARAIPPAHPGD